MPQKINICYEFDADTFTEGKKHGTAMKKLLNDINNNINRAFFGY